MAVEIARQPLARRYLANRCSLAYVFYVLCTLCIIILPYILAYTSESFWLKEQTVRVRPLVQFQHEALVSAQGALPGDRYLWSTSPALNEVFGAKLKAASVRYTEVDRDLDGTPERLNVQVAVPLLPGEEVHAFTALLALRYRLARPVALDLNAMAVVHVEGGRAGAGVQYAGDLQIQSDLPLFTPAGEVEGPDPLMGAASAKTLREVEPSVLISRYVDLPTAVHLVPRYPVWVPGGGASSFVANITMAVRPQAVAYAPRVPELLKFAWVQYLALLVPVFVIVVAARRFAAFQQITPCRVVNDLRSGSAKDHDF